jgi:hypothetical protein
MTFSPDEPQRYLYVMNGAEEKVHVVDHKVSSKKPLT